MRSAALPDGRRALCFKSREAVADEPLLNQAIVAFASDAGLVHAGILRSSARGKFDATSLDHAIWFHRPAAADDWLLHVQEATSAERGRGYIRGAIFNRAGRMVASVAQEILIRTFQDRRD